MNAGGLAKKQRYTDRLQPWVNQTVRGKLWEKYADLHTDVIGAQLKKPGHWAEKSLFLWELLLNITEQDKYQALLAIPLSDSEIPTERQALSLDYIESQVGLAPPSFHLFPHQSQDFKTALNPAFYLTALRSEVGREICFKKEKADEEYFRVIYIKNY